MAACDAAHAELDMLVGKKVQVGSLPTWTRVRVRWPAGSCGDPTRRSRKAGWHSCAKSDRSGLDSAVQPVTFTRVSPTTTPVTAALDC